jgi:hypothetical protein
MRAPVIYREQIEAYCRYRRLALSHIFSDIDFSGRRGAPERPGLQALIDRRHEFSAVVFPKLSRLGRSVSQLSLSSSCLARRYRPGLSRSESRHEHESRSPAAQRDDRICRIRKRRSVGLRKSESHTPRETGATTRGAAAAALCTVDDPTRHQAHRRDGIDRCSAISLSVMRSFRERGHHRYALLACATDPPRRLGALGSPSLPFRNNCL